MAFRLSQPWSEEYVKIRRGIPSRPSQCKGANCRLKPSSVKNHITMPILSFSIHPVIFGHQ